MNLEDDILIEKKLRNQLSKEERALFFNKIEQDPDFKQKLEFEKQLFQNLNEEEWSFEESKKTTEVQEYLEVIQSDEITKLKKQLKNENSIYQASIEKKSKSWFLYVAAAVIILFISIFNFIDFNSNPQELYADYLSKTELTSIITRGNHQDELAKAQTLFEEKEYAKALTIFEKEIKNKENQTGSIYIYTGISQMELNQFDKAEITFDKLISSDLLDAPKGYWFKALGYLKNNKTEKAKLILNKIVLEKLYNFKKAAALLKELN